jgi:fumarate reductase flavoprotein subunit
VKAGYDLVIVGGGNAGLAAAAAAGERGLRTLIVEKADEPGGQLHWSSGHFSAAGARRQVERGIEDHPDLHYEDVMRMGHGLNNAALVRLAVDTAASAVDWLEDRGFPFASDAPGFVTGHELYSRPRTYWGGEDLTAGGLPLLDTLLAAVEESDTVTVRTGTTVERLEVGSDGRRRRVTGVRLDGGSVVEADRVVLATGGYAASRALVAELQPDHASALTGCRDHATGDGHVMLSGLGVPMTHTETYVPTMGMIEDPERPGFGLRLSEARVVVDARQRSPWELWVNARGERFVAEDTLSPFEREAALRVQPDLAMWVLWDSVAMANADPVIGPGWTREAMAAQAARGTWLRAYEALDGLCADHGLPLATVRETVEAYNSGGPDPHGRAHRPAPLTEPPFFAVRVVGGMLLSRGGPVVDGRLRPVDGQGRPIGSLHAIGELLGMGQFSGDSFAGGMSVGPALALGRWVIGRIAAGGS